MTALASGPQGGDLPFDRTLVPGGTKGSFRLVTSDELHGGASLFDGSAGLRRCGGGRSVARATCVVAHACCLARSRDALSADVADLVPGRSLSESRAEGLLGGQVDRWPGAAIRTSWKRLPNVSNVATRPLISGRFGGERRDPAPLLIAIEVCDQERQHAVHQTSGLVSRDRLGRVSQGC